MSSLPENLLDELREIRPGLRDFGGVPTTPKAEEVMRRYGVEPQRLVDRYEREDLPSGYEAVLIGYRLSTEDEPDSETCVHVAFDPELDEVVIYEEW